MRCDLVAIGASWGGLAALQTLLCGLDGDFSPRRIERYLTAKIPFLQGCVVEQREGVRAQADDVARPDRSGVINPLAVDVRAIAALQILDL